MASSLLRKVKIHTKEGSFEQSNKNLSAAPEILSYENIPGLVNAKQQIHPPGSVFCKLTEIKRFRTDKNIKMGSKNLEEDDHQGNFSTKLKISARSPSPRQQDSINKYEKSEFDNKHETPPDCLSPRKIFLVRKMTSPPRSPSNWPRGEGNILSSSTGDKVQISLSPKLKVLKSNKIKTEDQDNMQALGPKGIKANLIDYEFRHKNTRANYPNAAVMLLSNTTVCQQCNSSKQQPKKNPALRRILEKNFSNHLARKAATFDDICDSNKELKINDQLVKNSKESFNLDYSHDSTPLLIKNESHFFFNEKLFNKTESTITESDSNECNHIVLPAQKSFELENSRDNDKISNLVSATPVADSPFIDNIDLSKLRKNLINFSKILE